MIGEIVNLKDGKIIIEAKYGYIDEIIRKQIKFAEIRLKDGREISIDQQRKIYAMFNDISLYTGYTPQETKELMKFSFISKYGGNDFSLSNVDMTTASKFIEYIIEFILIHDIPTKVSLLKQTDDIAHYIYMCLIYKKCCISGKRAELHHVDKVGMGRNRNEITHIGMKALPLSRKYHIEIHSIGQKAFEEKYHVFGVKIDEVIASKYKQIKGKNNVKTKQKKN